MPAPRADLYYALAECLAEPPEWLARPGSEWPLFRYTCRLASSSPAARRAMQVLPGIAEEGWAARQARYNALFYGPETPRRWLYESASLGRVFLSPHWIALERVYKAAGLESVGAELPDHASVELSFLACLAERQVAEVERAGEWRQVERAFIRQHAGRWLPELGRDLVRSGDEVYAPLGELLAGWLAESARYPGRVQALRPQHFRVVLPKLSDCILCGFCVQVCPTGVLTIQESEKETRLLATEAGCHGCRQCERICPNRALEIVSVIQKSRGGDQGLNAPARMALKSSPRATCPTCGEATVSRAELDFIASRIGSGLWQEYCLDCRSERMEASS